ncbi:MAG: CYTH domain-containing protein [Ignavibacteriae bacterium]|nr:CYTH domain-containing protein [Ignavibacteriota bacterium]
MKYEIERKFLVHKDKWSKAEKQEGKIIRQGYILTDPRKNIRIRVSGDNAFLTIKGLMSGIKRLEYEYEIPLPDANDLLDEFSESEITKIRYDIFYDNRKWEVDEFLDDNLGLIIAELELSSEDEKFDIPDWIDKEVTGEVKYYNSNLSVNPFKNW